MIRIAGATFIIAATLHMIQAAPDASDACQQVREKVQKGQTLSRSERTIYAACEVPDEPPRYGGGGGVTLSIDDETAAWPLTSSNVLESLEKLLER